MRRAERPLRREQGAQQAGVVLARLPGADREQAQRLVPGGAAGGSVARGPPTSPASGQGSMAGRWSERADSQRARSADTDQEIGSAEVGRAKSDQ
jgi:hypothetical protein